MTPIHTFIAEIAIEGFKVLAAVSRPIMQSQSSFPKERSLAKCTGKNGPLRAMRPLVHYQMPFAGERFIALLALER